MNNVLEKGNRIQFRADGHLENMDDWTPELAENMALAEDLTLTVEHWDVLNIMREYYQEYNTSPILKLLRRELSKQHGADRARVEALDRLFPRGVQMQGSRLAGVPLAMLDVELNQSQRIQSVGEASTNTAEVKHYNDEFVFNDKTISVYASGNLVNLADWNEGLAEILANKEAIKLTEDHWRVLNFLRKFYFEYGVTPMVKVLIRHMAEELGADLANRDHMYTLFPGGPAKQGSRIAGLPSPQGCIDS